MPMKICPTCGTEFVPTRTEQVYCRGACYDQAARQYPRRFSDEEELRLCAVYQAQQPDGSYLGSVELERLFGINRRTVYNILKRHGIPVHDASTAHKHKPSGNRKNFPPVGEQPPLCACACGQQTYWHQKKNRWAKYVVGHYTQRGTQNHSWASDPSILNADGRAMLTCPVCGKVFYRPAKDRTLTYCSEACAGIARRSPHYEGRERWYGWHSVRKHIRERDNWTCQDCGYEGKRSKRRMHVHHIDHNPMNNGDDNLVLLCHRCHLTRHGLTPPSDWPD